VRHQPSLFLLFDLIIRLVQSVPYTCTHAHTYTHTRAESISSPSNPHTNNDKKQSKTTKTNAFYYS
jgi:hypothetical protein